jgi:anaerobic dimethyl sulfoxide reductase subunit B (iron-sulfur subunit)
MTQCGFFIDLSRCTGCHACTIACKQWHDIPPGSVKWLRVYQWEKGTFPDIDLRVLPVMCFHCENPVCAGACPHGAIYKEGKYGAVLVDPDKCKGERKCWKACPYGAPQFEGDRPGLKMSKCDMCIDRLEKGDKPICVLSCSLRALEFGPINELREKWGTLRQLEEMPEASITAPAVVFKPADPKKQIVAWDYNKALKLWQKRQPDNGEPLPDIFHEITDVTQISEDITGRNRLVLKAKNNEELMFRTMDDE